jgi:signal recognition particle GTPase
MEKKELAKEILLALLQNPERYKYIASLVESKKISQENANEKNIKKAFKIADSFIKICGENILEEKEK